ncbi:hypothetical protein K458DRAFT_406590 [Lentithecium fluviatile CBS 122367]|uniref:Uncharacterized protein n=1 Tax=Lentithecium fluviatile CBS 122367 TaxID=1168545 RepID=A0A6G1IT00_9PLEO|nr:hypothetical protein K458DRAFT_406590 [Lentithecium fluviatile CBS 122367]
MPSTVSITISSRPTMRDQNNGECQIIHFVLTTTLYIVDALRIKLVNLGIGKLTAPNKQEPEDRDEVINTQRRTIGHLNVAADNSNHIVDLQQQTIAFLRKMDPGYLPLQHVSAVRPHPNWPSTHRLVALPSRPSRSYASRPYPSAYEVLRASSSNRNRTVAPGSPAHSEMYSVSVQFHHEQESDPNASRSSDNLLTISFAPRQMDLEPEDVFWSSESAYDRA